MSVRIEKFDPRGQWRPASIPGEVDLVQLKKLIKQLVELGHRGSTTANENLAAEMLMEQLEEQGIPCELEPFEGQISYGRRIVVHQVAALAALLILPWSAAASFMITFVTLVSFVMESSTFKWGLSGAFLSPGKSQNVVGTVPAMGGARRRIVLCAHLDTQKTGWIWSPRSMKFYSSTMGLAPGPVKAPLFLLTAMLLFQVVIGLLILFGQAGQIRLFPVMTIMTVVYSIGIILVAQWSAGKFVPGANDNASGVAGLMKLAARWNELQHVHTELIVLFTGCEEAGSLGAAAWIDRHRAEIDKVPTLFLNLDLIGCHQLHFLKDECALSGVLYHYPGALLELCREVADSTGTGFSRPHAIPTHTDGLAFLARGVPGVTITSSDDGIYVPNYHSMNDRIENLDMTAVARATEFAWQVLCRLEQFDPYINVRLDREQPSKERS